MQWGIWVRTRQPAGVDVVARKLHRIPGVRTHRSRRLRPRDCTVRDDIPVTTVARTLLDLGDALTAHHLARVVHEAAFRRRLILVRVEEAIRHGRGRRAAAILARALALYASGSAGTRSDLEDALLALVVDLGHEEPLVNVRLRLGTEDLEIDQRWEDRRLCVEIDGHGHALPRQRLQDAARDRILAGAGYQVIRVTGVEIAEAVASRRLPRRLAAALA